MKRAPAVYEKHKERAVGSIVLHAGVNDIRHRQSEILKADFAALIKDTKERTPSAKIFVRSTTSRQTIQRVLQSSARVEQLATGFLQEEGCRFHQQLESLLERRVSSSVMACIRTVSRRVLSENISKINSEFTRITTVPLETKFLAQLHKHSTKLLEVIKHKGGAVKEKTTRILQVLDEDMQEHEKELEQETLANFVTGKADPFHPHKDIKAVIEGREEDVDAFMKQPGNETADAVLRKLDEQYQKYKFMELNLVQKKLRLKNQIPQIKQTLEILKHMQKKKESTEPMETRYLLADNLYCKASVRPTDKVCLWLGANVMLEYDIDEAQALLEKNLATATRNLDSLGEDLDFLRDQCTTTEVSILLQVFFLTKYRHISG
ncbi:PFD3 protein, partial [Polypterus senegalus]